MVAVLNAGPRPSVPAQDARSSDRSRRVRNRGRALALVALPIQPLEPTCRVLKKPEPSGFQQPARVGDSDELAELTRRQPSPRSITDLPCSRSIPAAPGARAIPPSWQPPLDCVIVTLAHELQHPLEVASDPNQSERRRSTP